MERPLRSRPPRGRYRLRPDSPGLPAVRAGHRADLARAPEAAEAYRAVLARHGWALSELEEAAIGPVYRAFRVGLAADQVRDGLSDGRLDLAMIERQLTRAGMTAA
jgi:hypothetical protein